MEARKLFSCNVFSMAHDEQERTGFQYTKYTIAISTTLTLEGQSLCKIRHDSHLPREELLKDYRCTDNPYIFVLASNDNIIGNNQSAKQMKELHLKCEITLKRLDTFAAKCYL